jgi:hypothetical protein
MLPDKDTGQFMKWGITNDPRGRYSGEDRANTEMTVVAQGSREDMAAVERYLILTDPGPSNKEPFRGRDIPEAVDDPLV